MKFPNWIVIHWAVAACALAGGASVAVAADKSPKTPVLAPLSPEGEKLESRYTELLKGLRAEISRGLPAVDEQKMVAFQKARDAVKKAQADAKAAQDALSKVQQAKALVDHAKGKWIGGAEKNIAKAEAALKNGATDAAREAAKKELAKAQADKAAGVKALQERQAVLDSAKVEEPKLSAANRSARESLVNAQNHELAMAKAMLGEVETFLSNNVLDDSLVKCVVLAEATPRGLAEFAQQGPEQAAVVDKLLADPAWIREMLEAGGAEGGKYGQAMQIYLAILKVSPRASEGILHRLALGVSAAHATPIGQRNAVTSTEAPTTVDPVKRYLHYEKAYLDGELDPAFPAMTAWECSMIVNSDAPDHVLTWGRNMLRNYRPDHIFNPDYRWRYSGAVRTDVAYRHSNEYQDTESLEFFQNVCKNGGICGRRAFFGRFIIQSFGLPVWGVTQHAHAAVGRWTPEGWVVNLGADWQFSWFRGRSGPDFLLETQARKRPEEFSKALRAQWVGDALGEPKYQSMKDTGGGWWNMVALFKQKSIVAEMKPGELAAVGQDLAEANESSATKALAVQKAAITDADKHVVVAPNGVITVPAAACGQGNQLVKSFLGGQQLICGGAPFQCEVEAPSPGKYTLTARVVTVHDPLQLKLTLNNSKDGVEVSIPYTCGTWEQTPAIEVTLTKGKNLLSFSKPPANFSLKELTLTPVK